MSPVKKKYNHSNYTIEGIERRLTGDNLPLPDFESVRPVDDAVSGGSSEEVELKYDVFDFGQTHLS